MEQYMKIDERVARMIFSGVVEKASTPEIISRPLEKPDDVFEHTFDLLKSLGINASVDNQYINFLVGALEKSSRSARRALETPLAEKCLKLTSDAVRNELQDAGVSEEMANDVGSVARLKYSFDALKTYTDRRSADRRMAVDIVAESLERVIAKSRLPVNKARFSHKALKKKYEGFCDGLGLPRQFNGLWSEQECLSRIKELSLKLGLIVDTGSDINRWFTNFSEVFYKEGRHDTQRFGNEAYCRRILKAAYTPEVQ